MQQPGFQISMRWAPELAAFEVWVTYHTQEGERLVLQSREHPVTKEQMPGTQWDAKTPGQSAPASFTINKEETYYLTQELLRHGTYKPEKVEPDTEQIEWLRSMVERVAPTPQPRISGIRRGDS